MGARSGGGGGAAGGGSPAMRALTNAIQSGEFDKMSIRDQDRLMHAADKERAKLSEARNIYSDSEWDALDAYTGSGFERMNAHAVHGGGDAETKALVANMDKAIARRKLTKDIVVWRGSDKTESVSGRYVSTSISAKIANKFRTGKNMHAYRIPKGTHYLYTERKGEAEVILPRGFNLSKYKIK